MKIVKNKGQVPRLKGKYILKAYSKMAGEYMYSEIALKPIIFRLLGRFKYHQPF